MKRSYLFLAEGFEEVEALAVVDVMRRAGLDVKTVSITDNHQVAGAHGIAVVADLIFDKTDFSDADWLIIPGGLPGATNLASYAPLSDLLKAHSAAGGRLAAICASPAMVFGPLGILDNRKATGYPGTERQCGKTVWERQPVVIDHNVTTANGPASALLFALSIVGQTIGEAHARSIADAMLYYPTMSQPYFG